MSVHREGAAGHDQRAKLRCNATAGIATTTYMSAAEPPASQQPPDDQGLLEAARDEAERRAAESEIRRKADLDLRNELALEDFSGVGWDRFANELARYGIAVMVVWMRTGRIFVECARIFRHIHGKKFALPQSPLDWTDEERSDLAATLVTKALTTFKQKALRDGGWTYAGGASLSTYFVGTCTYEFPNAYTQWITQRKAAAVDRARADRIGAETMTGPADPATVVIRADQARRALEQVDDERTRIVVQLKAAGYSHAEIAEALGEAGFPGVSDEGVRGIWQRHKRRMHRTGGEADV